MSAGMSSRKRPHEPIEFSEPSPVEYQATRIFHAPRERFFRLFTNPATLPYMFSPNPELVTVEKHDFRPGGRYSILVKADDGSSMRFHGEFREIDPPRHLVNTTEIESFPGALVLETDDFESVGESTRLTIRWKYQSKEDRDRMLGPENELALTGIWDKVAELLDKQSAEPTGARA